MDKIYYVEIDNYGNSRFNSIKEEGMVVRVPCSAIFKNFEYWMLGGGCLYLSEDFKTVYCRYDADKYKFKVLNIQTKPFKTNYIKMYISACKEAIEEISKLKMSKRNIVTNAKKWKGDNYGQNNRS